MEPMLESAEHSDSELSDTHTVPTPDITPLKRKPSLINSASNASDGPATPAAVLSDGVAVRCSGRRRGPRPEEAIGSVATAGASSAVDSKLQASEEASVTKKRRTRPVTPREVFHFEPPYTAATTQDKSSWGGFCELESDPAVFNNVLHNLGVDGIKVQEVYSLEPEILDMLPKPVHGLLFLFEYTAEADEAGQSKECPQDVWFANQVVDNCCGTIALLNVINNIPASELLLSEQMTTFKDFTLPFSPAFRGDQVANCDFIKRAHNVYARQIDMWNADLMLEEKWTEGQKKQRKKSRGRNRRSSRKTFNDSTYHFVAYMPIRGEMWRMDGLDDYAQSLGRCANGVEDWVSEVAPLLSAQMATYAEQGVQVQFSLLAINPDGSAATRVKLARSRETLRAIDSKLATLQKDVKQIAESPAGHPHQSHTNISSAKQNEQEISTLLAVTDVVSSLQQLHGRELELQQKLQRQLELEQFKTQSAEADATSEEVRALDRQNDYVPFLQRWLMMLAENQQLKDLVEAHQW